MVLAPFRSCDPTPFPILLQNYNCSPNDCIEVTRTMPTMRTITVATQRKDEVVDLTDTVAAFVRAAAEQGHGEPGVCMAFAAHTTCALTTADLDPCTDPDLLDYLSALRKLLPPGAYRHPHNPAHAPDHLLSSLLGPSVAIPFAGGRLLLGTWQRIVLVE